MTHVELEGESELERLSRGETDGNGTRRDEPESDNLMGRNRRERDREGERHAQR